MHPSSVNNMKRMRDKHLSYLTPSSVILDIGGRGLTSDRSYRQLFDNRCSEYHVADICDGLGVTHIMPGPYTLPFEDNSIDLVVSGQMLEHCSNPFKSVNEMKRVLKVGCRMVIVAPSGGPRHDTQDGWRFYEDAFRFISEDIGKLRIVDDYIDRTAPDQRSRKWADHVFVGEKQ